MLHECSMFSLLLQKLESDVINRRSADDREMHPSPEQQTIETHSNADETNVYGENDGEHSDESNSNLEEILNAAELDENDKNDDGSITQMAVDRLKIESWNDYPWKCSDCDVLTVDIHDLRQHHISDHQSTTKYCCVDCPKIFNKYATFLNHVRGRHRSHLKFW